ncbi:glycosyltransferase [Rhizorhabdus sp.]|uniref:CgeB family protein n=1 Tax=Rhizorhabdus sp. TaxID=1968843 RepID=UPI0019B86D8A|nr:glycosyltransferase [Rhizorhabdus sp.]MBD3760736.1 glycosyltransferase [Rhizorhabdus sp.]
MMDLPDTYRRIVIAAEHWFGATGGGLAHGFRELGWDVVEADPKDHYIMGRTAALRLAARVLRKSSTTSYNNALLWGARMSNPLAFLAVKGSYINVESLRKIKKQGIITALFYPDVHFDHPGMDLATFDEYDLFFTTKSFHIDYLSKRLGADRVRYLPHGYSSLVHRPRYEEMEEANYIADVLYVGNHSAYKEAWLKEIAGALPDIQLMIVGNGWSPDSFPGATVVGRHVLGDGYARLLQSARINIAVHFGPTGPDNWEDMVSTRTFQTPASKGFMLHIDNPEVRSLFDIGTEIDVFSSPGELSRKIRHYLDNPEQRARMIEAAYYRAVPAYSYNARAHDIAAAINALAASGAPGRTNGPRA